MQTSLQPILEPKAKAEMEQQKAMGTRQKDETEQNWISPEGYGSQAFDESIRKRLENKLKKKNPHEKQDSQQIRILGGQIQ
jgi:hypothetical protein